MKGMDAAASAREEAAEDDALLGNAVIEQDPDGHERCGAGADLTVEHEDRRLAGLLRSTLEALGEIEVVEQSCAASARCRRCGSSTHARPSQAQTG